MDGVLSIPSIQKCNCIHFVNSIVKPVNLRIYIQYGYDWNRWGTKE